MAAPPPREIIAQRYRLLGQIGKGGMGSVWIAEHTSLKTRVAVKLLDPKLAEDATLRARFLREAKSAAALKSAHVVQILDHGVDDGVPYIAMELLDGESLRARLSREKRLEPAAAGRVLAGILRAVARAHRAGIVHRDLKPDNVFLARDEDHGEVIKVLDFGIAKLRADSSTLQVSESGEGAIETATGTVLGTPYYMSPEQLRGKKDIDARSDLWAIGVIAFECLAGSRPFVEDSIGELVLTICTKPPPVPSSVGPVPEGFDAWFAKAVALDPAARFQSASALATALQRILAPGEPWLPAELDTSTPPSSPAAVEVATPPSLAVAATVEVPSDPRTESASAAVQDLTTAQRARRATRGGPWAYGAALGGLAMVAGVVYLTTLRPAGGDAAASSKSARAVESATQSTRPASDAPTAAPVLSASSSAAVSASALPPPSASASAGAGPAGTTSTPRERGAPAKSAKPTAAPTGAAPTADPRPLVPDVPADPG